jgi:malate synthase
MISTSQLADQQPTIEFLGHLPDRAREILGPDALSLLIMLHQRFNPRRLELLDARRRRQQAIDQGARPDFLAETAGIRAANWRIAPVPEELRDRRLEITGPVDRKMIINALNSPAKVFMADLEDSCSPTWENILLGQLNLRDAVDRSINF